MAKVALVGLTLLATIACAKAKVKPDPDLQAVEALRQQIQDYCYDVDQFQHQVDKLVITPKKKVTVSYYGSQFNGKLTASGVRFDMWGLTCASRTLPLGTRLWLSNPLNHRWCFAIVTDRGPYVQGRDLDVSLQVARTLRITHAGVVHLMMRRIPDEICRLREAAKTPRY